MRVLHPELVVAAAIAVSIPAFVSFVDGAISVPALLVRFAVALALCWAADVIIEGVYAHYSREARNAEIQRQINAAVAPANKTSRQPGKE